VERFINILIIDSDTSRQVALKEMLLGGGNNIHLSSSIQQAKEIIAQKEIGILLINTDDEPHESIEFLKFLNGDISTRSIFKISLTKNLQFNLKIGVSTNQTTIDFLNFPLNPDNVRSKIDIYKMLYYKDQRINQLLSNIFPSSVLEDFYYNLKFSPKRVEQGVVLFADFVNFSAKSKVKKPIQLLKKLEYYFTKFDEIMQRYKLEKIKTIGDAYMALAGVTEKNPEPAIRACLAAIEIRSFVMDEIQHAEKQQKEPWEIRIGLHQGPLVAGIIGTSKMSFDVWGDTVNIAARAQQGTDAGTIAITKKIADEVDDYFDMTSRGALKIHKRGGTMQMFFLNQLKTNYQLKPTVNIANAKLRQMCGLTAFDFQYMRSEILQQMTLASIDTTSYHEVTRTINMEKIAVRISKLEGVDNESLMMLQTAVLYCDTGYIFSGEQNGHFAIDLVKKNLPYFGYSPQQVAIICSIIAVARLNITPNTLLEQIMCDADSDYLGRADYYLIANRLRKELEQKGTPMTDLEWIHYQLHYLEEVHRYFTETAKNIRERGKLTRIKELKSQLKQIK
jgi:adenylate cyclase